MRHLIIPIALTVACISGCVSSVTVKPGASDDGISYSLPQTYLLVSPAADGTVTYQWLYLPDERRQYNIQSSTVLAKYTLDVQLENGLLKQVGGQQDSTGVSSQLLKSVATIASAGAKSANASSGSGKGGGGSGGGGNSGDNSQNGSGSDGSGGKGGGSNGGSGSPADNQSKQSTTKPANDTSGSKGPTIVPGRIAAAYGPVLFRIDIDETNGATFVPVNFPAVTLQTTSGNTLTNTAGPQVLFESNELAHTVSFSPVKVSGTILTTESDYPLDANSVSNIQIIDNKTKKPVDTTITSMVADSTVGRPGSTIGFQTGKALVPGTYTLSFGYAEKGSSTTPSTASLNVQVAIGG
jgi:hypothetical protein